MFCIMRTEKRKRTDITGIQKENNRTATGYNNSVNRERSELNVPLIQSNNWTQDIKAEIDRAGAHTRSNSVVALDTLYTASPQFFDDKTQEQTEHFFKECLQFHQERFGHIISAVIHYDETTPHLHVVSVPLTQDGRLSARDVIGNRAKMSRTQDMFYEQVGKVYGLDRGERGDGQEKKEHTSAQEHKLREVKANKERELEELDAIKSSKSHARARAEKWRQKAYEQEIDKQRLQSQIEAERAVLQNVTAERERVEKQVKQLQGFLTLAEQRQLEETIYTDRDSERF